METAVMRAAIGSPASLKTIVGVAFRNETIDLDQKRFVDCTLVDCTLNYSGGEIVFERTHIRRCRHVFFGRARRTLHYLQGVGLMPHDPAEWAEFSNHVQ